jgi:hypothetical protein
MYRIYQVEKHNWRIIAVPERKLPRGFIVTTTHTLKVLEPNSTYEMKVAAVNTHGQGEWSKLIYFSLNSKGILIIFVLHASKLPLYRLSSSSPPWQLPPPPPLPCKPTHLNTIQS